MIIRNNSIKFLSCIHVGGVVEELLVTDSLLELVEYLKKHQKYISISNCSKILFAFDNLKIPLVKFTKNNIIYYQNSFFAYSGIRLSQLNNQLSKKGITGFESLATIPGLLGGSIVNNSSFDGQCISDLILKILIFQNNRFLWVDKKECNFSYRNSNLNQESMIIIGALFKLVRCNPNDVNDNTMIAFRKRKEKKHNYLNNLGSTFKNLEGIYIGQVLEKLGFKGYCFNDKISISNEHANFLIIKNDCKYEDILLSLTFLSKVLYNYLGKKVELEIQIIDKYGKRKYF